MTLAHAGKNLAGIILNGGYPFPVVGKEKKKKKIKKKTKKRMLLLGYL